MRFDSLSKIQKILFLVLGITLILSLANIFLEIRNNRLENNIEDLIEKKANLRAKYLSQISMGKLSSKAGELEMQQISHLSAKKASTKEAKELEKLMKKKLSEEAKLFELKRRLIVSGY